MIGIEAVLADGSVVRRLPGMAKDNTGYHLPSLLTGSEGTLAVITRAHLRLAPLKPRHAVALLGLASAADAVAVAADLRGRLPALVAAELFFDAGLEVVLRHTGADRPFRDRHPAYLLLEVEGDADPTDQLASAVADAGAVVDAVIASDDAGRARLWRLRESHTEAISAEGIAHKLDVGLPMGRLADFIDRVATAVEEVAPGSRVYLYGHVCDGNLHVGIIGPPPEDEAVDDAVLGLTVEMGGTVSAEHGIGAAKVAWLESRPRSRRRCGHARHQACARPRLDPEPRRPPAGCDVTRSRIRPILAAPRHHSKGKPHWPTSSWTSMTASSAPPPSSSRRHMTPTWPSKPMRACTSSAPGSTPTAERSSAFRPVRPRRP